MTEPTSDRDWHTVIAAALAATGEVDPNLIAAMAEEVAEALTAAGWPNTYQPNPDVTAAPATVALDLDAIRSRAARASGAMGWLDSPPDRADEPWLESQAHDVIAASSNDVPTLLGEVERLRGELHDQEGRLIGQLHVMEQRVIKAERERDEARAALDRIAGYHGGPDGLNPDLVANLAGSRTREAREAAEEWRRKAEQTVVERDQARESLRLVSSLHADSQAVLAVAAQRDAAQAEVERLTAERDAERERADNLAREVAELRDSLAIVEPQAAAYDRLRAGIEALRAHATQERAGWDAAAQHPNSVPAAVLTDIIDRLGALLDGTTPAPNTTQPYADLCRAVVALADETMRTAEHVECGCEDCSVRLARLARRMLALVPDVPPDMPAGPPSSPTSHEPAPGDGQDTTEAQEADRGTR